MSNDFESWLRYGCNLYKHNTIDQIVEHDKIYLESINMTQKEAKNKLQKYIKKYCKYDGSW